jgi:hypothetical protein
MACTMGSIDETTSLGFGLLAVFSIGVPFLWAGCLYYVEERRCLI